MYGGSSWLHWRPSTKCSKGKNQKLSKCTLHDALNACLEHTGKLGKTAVETFVAKYSNELVNMQRIKLPEDTIQIYDTVIQQNLTINIWFTETHLENWGKIIECCQCNFCMWSFAVKLFINVLRISHFRLNISAFDSDQSKLYLGLVSSDVIPRLCISLGKRCHCM